MMPKKPRYDTSTILQSVDIIEVIQRLGVPLKKSGAEFEACCPFHSEKTPSFKVNPVKQLFYCFGCGNHGDAIRFAREYLKIDFRQACEIVAGGVVPLESGNCIAKPKAEKKTAEWIPILPVPFNAPKPPREHPYRGEPLAIYSYKSTDGALLGYTYRLQRSDGGKTVEPLVWAKNSEGVSAWRWLSFQEPRPLYGLDRLAEKPNAPVLIVEGEKCADVGYDHLFKLAVVSWPGGGKAPKKADFSPLAGRRVILWPDCDAKREKLTPEERKSGVDPESKPILPVDAQPGIATMNTIRDILWALEPLCDVWMVDIPSPDATRDGWDIADLVAEGTTGEALAEWIRVRSRRLARPADPISAGAAAVGDVPTVAPTENVITPNFAIDSSARKAFLKRIEATTNFDELVYQIAQEVESSPIGGATKHNLLKTIAKKAGLSLSALRGDMASPPHGGGHDDDGINSAIDELNQLHAIVRLGGSTRIMTERISSDTGQLDITFCGRQDFELLYSNRFEYLNGERMDLATAWLQHPRRRQYEEVIFQPGLQTDESIYNLWRGHGVEPKPGDKHLLFLDFMVDSICAGKTEAFDYVLRWMAHLVQKPGDLPGSALVMRSGQRTGKGTFAEILGRLVGSAHYVELTDQAHLVGQFKGQLERALLVHASEALWGGDKHHEGTIKAMITDSRTIMEKKRIDAYSVRNYKRLIVSTNNDFPVPRDSDDARLVVLDTSDAHKEDHEFFSQLWADMESGGYENLMHFLLQIDISNWHPRKIPRELRKTGFDMKISSADSFTRWWYECLWQGWITKDTSFGGNDPTYNWPEEMTCERLRECYMAWGRALNLNSHAYIHITRIGRKLASWGVSHGKIGDDPLRRRNGYLIPSLETARALFSETMTMSMEEWPEL